MAEKKIALERILSKQGLASRTQARKLILAGEVRVNGKIELSPLRLVNMAKAKIEIHGKNLEKAPMQTLLFHKPRGVVTTRSDEKGRPTVFSGLRVQSHISPVGRLDQATTGLLLFTNDTRFANWLLDPANQISRIYVVTVRGLVTDASVLAIEAGMQEGGEYLVASKVEILKKSRRETHLRVTLTEGKNREIRRLFGQLGHEVTRLKRIAFGGLSLGALPVGAYRELSQEELQRYFKNYFLRHP